MVHNRGLIIIYDVLEQILKIHKKEKKYDRKNNSRRNKENRRY